MRCRRSRRRSTPRLVLWSISVFALVVVVSDSAAASGPAVKEPKYGFSLTLPPKWTTIPINGSDITSLLNSATHDDPSLANVLSTEVKAATAQGIKVFAVGPLAGTSMPNVNIAAESSSGEPSGKAFAPAAAVQAKISLTEAGAKAVKTSVIHDRLGTAARVLYALPLKTGTVYGVQFYAEHTSHIAIMTVTTSSASTSLATADTIEASWRWSRS